MNHLSRIAAAALFAAGALAPAAAAQPSGGNLLYLAEGPGGASVYMLGSIHLLTPDVYPLPQPMQAAYADAERVFFEINLDSAASRQGEMLQRGMFPDGQSLRSAIPADLYAQLERAVAGYAQFGVTMPVLDRFEPWMVGMTLSALEWQKAGLSPEHGIDAHFNGRALRDGKPVGSLESVDFQMGLFDGFTPAQQVDFLRQTLDDLPRTPALMRDMVAAWRSGDEVVMDSLMNESMDDYPALYDRMLTDRNAAWVPQIETMLRGADDVLVVVGAAHLVGDRSVVAMLRQRGYTIQKL